MSLLSQSSSTFCIARSPITLYRSTKVFFFLDMQEISKNCNLSTVFLGDHSNRTIKQLIITNRTTFELEIE